MKNRIRPWVLALGLALSATPVLSQSKFDVVVDFTKTGGLLKNVAGVTCGPIGPYKGGIDLTNEFKWMRVPSVRIHDCYDVGDIDKVFPNFSADEKNPANYDFKDADALVNSIVRADMKVLYRIGYSWGRVTKPPADFDKFARICEHIAKHYTQGWAGGYAYSKHFEWEIWNEANLRNAWTGTPTQFYSLYEKCVRAIRGVDPNAVVGTCALAVNWPIDYQERLIAHCAANSVPLDFYSWHYYGFGFDQPQPYNYVRHGRWVRTLLDKYGFRDAKNYLTEWNILHPSTDARLKNMVGAAYTLSSLLFMQESSIDLAHHYRGDQCDQDCGGLFDITPTKNDPIPRANAIHLFSRLLDTPVRLHTTGSDRSGFAAEAGRSKDGHTIQVLMSDFWSRGTERRLIFENLPVGTRLLQVFDLTAKGIRLTSTAHVGPHAPIELPLPKKAPWIRFVRLLRSSDVALTADASRLYHADPTGTLRIDAPHHAAKRYLAVGGLSGISPGTELGRVVLPLNLDFFTYSMVLNLSREGYRRLQGELDEAGRAEIPFRLDPLSPALKGRTLHMAAAILGPNGFDATTEVVAFTID